MKEINQAIEEMKLGIDKRSKESIKIYGLGIMKEARNFTMLRASDNLGLNYEKMQYFISEARFDDREIHWARLEWTFTKSEEKEYDLVLDDTANRKYVERYFSPKSYIGNIGKVDLANTTVFATLQTEQLVIPFDFKPYLSAAQFPAKEKDPQFRSKIQLAESLVQNSVACEKAYGINIRYVVGDKIYAANWFMDKLEQGQMKYFFSLDPKRRVANISHLSLNFDSSKCKNLLSFVTALDFTTSVEVCSEYSLAKTSHRHKIFSFITNFRGLNHKVKVFIFSSSKKIHFYCSNDLDMDFSTALRLYLKRSRIDNVFFKNVKSFLALSRCHFHNLKSYLRHFHICLLLFSIILFFSRSYRKSFYRTLQAIIKI